MLMVKYFRVESRKLVKLKVEGEKFLKLKGGANDFQLSTCQGGALA